MSEINMNPVASKGATDIFQESLSDTPSQPDAATSPYIVSSIDHDGGDEAQHAAQTLHTQVYLEKGFITEDEIDEDGLFTDEYTERSVYFVAESNNRRTSCRFIKATKRGGLMSLPTAQHFSIDPEVIKKAAGVKSTKTGKTTAPHRLTDIKPKEVIEVSGLASVREGLEGEDKRDGLNATRLLYAKLLRESLDSGHKLWLLNTHEGLVRSLKTLLGKEQVHELGEVKEYMGSPTIPVAINPQEVVRTALEDGSRLGEMKREYLKETLAGVSDRYLSKDIIELLDKYDIPYEKSTNLQRILRNRKAMAIAGLTGYALARAAPVAGVEGFEGSAAVFAALDVGTVPSYAWGLAETVAGKSLARRVVAANVAAASFAAPYVYFWAEGNDYPAYVNAVAGGIVGTAATLEVLKMRKDKVLERQLVNDD